MDVFTALRPLPYVHPLLVHFPVVLLLAAAALEALALATRHERLAVAARWMLWAGTLAAGLTYWSGHESAEALEDTVSPDARALIELHEDCALVVLVGAGGLSVLRLLLGERRWRGAAVVLAIGLAIMVALVAHLGGQLVYLHGVAVRPS